MVFVISSNLNCIPLYDILILSCFSCSTIWASTSIYRVELFLHSWLHNESCNHTRVLYIYKLVSWKGWGET
jgi:hypothetical protein